MLFKFSRPGRAGHIECDDLAKVLNTGLIGVVLDKQIGRRLEIGRRLGGLLAGERQRTDHRRQQNGGLRVVGFLADSLEENGAQPSDRVLRNSDGMGQPLSQHIEVAVAERVARVSSARRPLGLAASRHAISLRANNSWEVPVWVRA